MALGTSCKQDQLIHLESSPCWFVCWFACSLRERIGLMMEEESDYLSSLSKEELIEKIKSLENQLSTLKIATGRSSPIKTEWKNQKPFDFTRYSKVHIALKFLYLGWKFDGFVQQENFYNTIEDHIFSALIKIKLIESRETSNYQRCGRTDIGVSAFSQVISITVRGLPLEQVTDSKKKARKEPLNYAGLLNRVLPPEIRIISWAPVPDDFSARFSCYRRMYKYIFPKGTLNIEKMNEAAGYLVGEHDFSNFCKLDKNKLSHVRTVIRADVQFYSNSFKENDEDDYSMVIFTIISNAFLWHQIRCIMEVLFLVGEEKEDPTIVKELLDRSIYPYKPQYSLASGLPLCLFDTEFITGQIDWNIDKEAMECLLTNLQTLWSQNSIKSNMIKLMIENLPGKMSTQATSLKGERSNQHKKLIFRPVEKKKAT